MYINFIYVYIYVDKRWPVKYEFCFVIVVCNYMTMYIIFWWTTVWVSAQNRWRLVILCTLLVQRFAHASVAVYG